MQSSAASSFEWSQEQEMFLLRVQVTMQAAMPGASHDPADALVINICGRPRFHVKPLENTNGRILVGALGVWEQ